MKIFNSTGQSLVELLVAIGLAAILLPALLTGLVASREGKAQESQRLLATGYMREMSEAARSVREGSWNTFAVNGTYHPAVAGSAWSLVTGAESINNFTRQLVISDIQRDAGGAIVDSGGTVDPSTKKIDYTVSWSGSYSGSVTGTEYFTRFLSNAAWLQTTQAQFNGDTLTNTVTTNNSGGEVQLAASTSGSWTSPTSAGTFNAAGNTDGLAVAVSGNYAYLGVANSGGSAFYILNVSNPASVTQVSSMNLGVNVTGVYVSGNYAYLSTSGNSSELMIINVTNKNSPTTASTLNLGGNEDATSIFVSGNYAYVGKNAGNGANRELYVLNISNPASPSVTGSYEVGSNVNSVYVSGNYAYLATADNSNELIIVNVSTPSSPSLTASLNVSGTGDGQSIFVSGNTAYLGTANNASFPEFYIINASNPSSPSLTGSYEVGNGVNGIFISGSYAFLANDLNNQELQIVNVASPSSPSLYGSFNLGGPGDSVVVSGDYAFVGNNNNGSELNVILGGSGGGAYVTGGTIESSTFDAGASAAFNYLTFTGSTPSGTTLTLQLAINNDNATWNYFGSYTIPGSIPLTSMTGRYIRYKATLGGNGSATPVLSDVSVNYSL